MSVITYSQRHSTERHWEERQWTEQHSVEWAVRADRYIPQQVVIKKNVIQFSVSVHLFSQRCYDIQQKGTQQNGSFVSYLLFSSFIV
jgi:hypothetical protein